MRVHICWGNGEYPRTHDIALAYIIGEIFNAKPGRNHSWTRMVRMPTSGAAFKDVTAATNCGFANAAGMKLVAPLVACPKLWSIAEGADRLRPVVAGG